MRLTVLLMSASLVLAAGVANANDTNSKTSPVAAKHHFHKGHKRCHHKDGMPCDHMMHDGTMAQPAMAPSYTSPTAWPVPDRDMHHPLAPAGAL